MSDRVSPSGPVQSYRRARLALEGLSVGDAFGQRFFDANVAALAIGTRSPPPGPWRTTDDTAMALAIFQVLARYERIDSDELAKSFLRTYADDPRRGYGGAMHDYFAELARGVTWQDASRALFGGEGTMGNGGAMRVAPVGAYFAYDLKRAAHEARRSAEVTHAHPEGQAGAIAVGVAAAWTWQWASSGRRDFPLELLRVAADFTPPGATRDGIERALATPLDEWEFTVAEQLGCGAKVSAPDTVPFCLWCAAAHLTDYSEALWTAVRVGGDIDTNAAIIGGIVAMAVGIEGIPFAWRKEREDIEWPKES